jgi:hypothetical protein
MFRSIIAALLLCHATVAAALGRMAELSIYDRNERRTLPVYWHKGEAWIVGRPGNEYQISVRSKEGRDMLAVLSVDGVNVVTGETAAPHQSGYVVSSGDTVHVRGWRKSLSRTAAFYFTELSDSYAARTGRPDNVGVIGVALFGRKDEPLPPPVAFDAPGARPAPRAAESVGARQHQEAAASPMLEKAERLGTGHGRTETSPARQVTFERATQSPEEVITIRYDSYANLLARGVIVAHQGKRPARPEPFPARFVPDPPRIW